MTSPFPVHMLAEVSDKLPSVPGLILIGSVLGLLAAGIYCGLDRIHRWCSIIMFPLVVVYSVCALREFFFFADLREAILAELGASYLVAAAIAFLLPVLFVSVTSFVVLRWKSKLHSA